jgi:hypothetical protein
MTRYALAALAGIIVLCSGLYADSGGHGEEHTDADEHAFLHPFLAHMGLPDEPGEVSFRLTGYTARHEEETESDIAVHLEAGLAGRLGLHIRAEGIRHGEYSEIMVQYAVLVDHAMENGISIFGQLSLPTGPVETDTYKGLFGVSGRLTLQGVLMWDGNVHYDPDEEMAEHENAVVFKAREKLYPILEVRGHAADDVNEAYVMLAMKFAVNGHMGVGVGYQAAVTDDRHSDSQALLTLDAAF